ncbi:hypothetical protein QBC47DRAFT_182978 [Echria macrotheca]|uniref:Uncharacterized protein n=1 Tax=Echria macrotheca TaxID=438768 RepID=A0AAJ0F5Y0_9PEZI|nr:hypothetical protein QBC47DRAFT_182978 [Echria macrotheca]
MRVVRPRAMPPTTSPPGGSKAPDLEPMEHGFLRDQIIEANCEFISQAHARFWLVVSQPRPNEFNTSVVKTEYNGRRRLLLSGSGKSLLEAFKQLLFCSSQAVARHVDARGYEYVSDEEEEGDEIEESYRKNGGYEEDYHSDREDGESVSDETGSDETPSDDEAVWEASSDDGETDEVKVKDSVGQENSQRTLLTRANALESPATAPWATSGDRQRPGERPVQVRWQVPPTSSLPLLQSDPTLPIRQPHLQTTSSFPSQAFELSSAQASTLIGPIRNGPGHPVRLLGGETSVAPTAPTSAAAGGEAAPQPLGRSNAPSTINRSNNPFSTPSAGYQTEASLPPPPGLHFLPSRDVTLSIHFRGAYYFVLQHLPMTRACLGEAAVRYIIRNPVLFKLTLNDPRSGPPATMLRAYVTRVEVNWTERDAGQMEKRRLFSCDVAKYPLHSDLGGHVHAVALRYLDKDGDQPHIGIVAVTDVVEVPPGLGFPGQAQSLPAPAEQQPAGQQGNAGIRRPVASQAQRGLGSETGERPELPRGAGAQHVSRPQYPPQHPPQAKAQANAQFGAAAVERQNPGAEWLARQQPAERRSGESHPPNTRWPNQQSGPTAQALSSRQGLAGTNVAQGGSSTAKNTKDGSVTQEHRDTMSSLEQQNKRQLQAYKVRQVPGKPPLMSSTTTPPCSPPPRRFQIHPSRQEPAPPLMSSPPSPSSSSRFQSHPSISAA